MVLVPGMPQEDGTLGEPFYIARHELTAREFMTAAREANCPLPAPASESIPISYENPTLYDDFPSLFSSAAASTVI